MRLQQWPQLSALLGLAFASIVAAQSTVSQSPASTMDELEAVLVTGERPGPALWKVTRKGNTLWILPTFGPLPDGLVLRSSQLEAVIKVSQEVHFLTSITPPPSLENDARARNAYLNVDGKHLQDVVSQALHAQFRELADRYASGSMMIENYRPTAAADWLKEMAMRRLQLTSDRTIQTAVNELARKYGVKTFGVKMTHDEVWDDMISRLEKIPREEDEPCAKEKLDHLENDLRDSVARANAWAKGDIATLREDKGLNNARKDSRICAKYFREINVGVVQERALQRYRISASARWLKKNHSTLALVPIAALFDSDGLLRKLRRAGYKIEEPVMLTDKED